MERARKITWRCFPDRRWLIALFALLFFALFLASGRALGLAGTRCLHGPSPTALPRLVVRAQHAQVEKIRVSVFAKASATFCGRSWRLGDDFTAS